MAQMTALRTTSLATALGGRKVIKGNVSSTRDLLRSVEAGLPYGALDAVMTRFGLARTEIAQAVRLPMWTLARRKRERRLHPDEADRLIRVALVAAEAARILVIDER